jgi:hypothetical protein
MLCARKLIELDSDRPSPAKVAAVENAISQAKGEIHSGQDRRAMKRCHTPFHAPHHGLCDRGGVLFQQRHSFLSWYDIGSADAASINGG